MAADSAVMVIDGSKGVEKQTIKLFKVCVMRNIPIITFINKMDRDAKNPFDLLEDIENVLGINTYPVNWPIGSGKEFKGVFDRNTEKILAFTANNGQREVEKQEYSLDDPALDEVLGQYLKADFMDEIELLDGAGDAFDLDAVRQGRLTPVFFGSALTNFGVEPFLEQFLQLTTSPLARETVSEEVDPMSEDFSAFVFKIQANMNKAHRDRVAFMRICSGKFEKNMEVFASRSRSRSWHRSARSWTKPMPAILSACLTRASSPSATPSARRATRYSSRAFPPLRRSTLHACAKKTP